MGLPPLGPVCRAQQSDVSLGRSFPGRKEVPRQGGKQERETLGQTTRCSFPTANAEIHWPRRH